MKTTLEILFLVFIYSVLMFLFGMWVEDRIISKALHGIVQEAWTQGCHKCTEFQDNQESRDQLQGVRTEPEKIEVKKHG